MPSGTPTANFNVITSEKWTDRNGQPQERVYGHRVVAYGALVEKVIVPYLKRGSRVMVEGKMHPRSYETNGQIRWIHEVTIDINGRLMLMESREDAQRRQANRGAAQTAHSQALPEEELAPADADPFDGDLPF